MHLANHHQPQSVITDQSPDHHQRKPSQRPGLLSLPETVNPSFVKANRSSSSNDRPSQLQSHPIPSSTSSTSSSPSSSSPSYSSLSSNSGLDILQPNVIEKLPQPRFNLNETSALLSSKDTRTLSMSEPSKIISVTRSPGLDALAYVSSVELPKFSLNPQTNGQDDISNVEPSGIRQTLEEDEEETSDGRVRAYAKLEFPEHDFFIRKLSVIIGRRPPAILLRKESDDPADHVNSLEKGSLGEEAIDVDLGPIRAVSRKHSKVYFNWNFGTWVLEVLGRNGCVIDGGWKARGEVIPLRSRTKIQIAERIFYFILPQTEEPARNVNLLNHCSNETPKVEPDQSLGGPNCLPEDLEDLDPDSEDEADEDFDACCLEKPDDPTPPNTQTEDSQAVQFPVVRAPADDVVDFQPTKEAETPLTEPPGSPRCDSGSEDDLDKSDEEPRPPSPPRNRSLYNPDEKVERVDFHLIKGESDSSDSEDDDMVTESENSLEQRLPRKAPASKAPRKAPASKKPVNNAGGRGKGKNHFQPSVAAKKQIVNLEPPQPPEPPEPEKPKTNGKDSSKGKAKAGGKSKDTGNQQKSKEAHKSVVVKERPKIKCVTPAGAEIGTVTQKPPYTYASLITQALAAQADEDGKMLVSEMCEWMAGVYPFYGTKEKGSDWQSALRHNLNADKRFKRIERTPADGGKGNFWTLKPEEWVNFDGLELKRAKNDSKANNNNHSNISKNDSKANNNNHSSSSKHVAGPGKSIGSVARTDVGAHHRTAARARAPTPESGPKPPAPIPVSNSLISPQKSQSENSSAVSAKASPTKPIEVQNLVAVASPSRSTITPSSKSASRIVASKPDIHPALLLSSIGSTPASTPPPPPPPISAPQPPPQTSKTRPPFKIVIEELPSSVNKKSGSAATSVRNTEELSKLIEEDPPMFSESESNKLILNPRIFKSLKPSQVSSLERLGSTAAIQILQKFIVEYYKEKIKKKQSQQQNSNKTQLSNNSGSNSENQNNGKRKFGEGNCDKESRVGDLNGNKALNCNSNETKKVKTS